MRVKRQVTECKKICILHISENQFCPELNKAVEKKFYERKYPKGPHAYEKMLNTITHQKNANESHNEISFTPTRMAKLKRLTVTRIGEAVEQLEFSYVSSGSIHWDSHFGKMSDSFS